MSALIQLVNRFWPDFTASVNISVPKKTERALVNCTFGKAKIPQIN